jgi:hypothetical protein
MSEPHLTNAWCWLPDPPPSVIDPWQVECWTGGSHYVIYGATQEAAQDRFYLEHPELRGVVRWLLESPPRPKRDEPKPAAIEKAFHSDHHGRRKFTCDEMAATVNRLWDEARANHGDVK